MAMTISFSITSLRELVQIEIAIKCINRFVLSVLAEEEIEIMPPITIWDIWSIDMGFKAIEISKNMKLNH